MTSATTFANLAISQRTQSLSTNSKLKYGSHFMREYGSNNLNGTIAHPLAFDGYTCRDNREKLQMTTSTSYASSSFTNANNLNNFTVEFWFRSSQNYETRDSHLMGLLGTLGRQ